jgi:hypothetical protein
VKRHEKHLVRHHGVKYIAVNVEQLWMERGKPVVSKSTWNTKWFLRLRENLPDLFVFYQKATNVIHSHDIATGSTGPVHAWDDIEPEGGVGVGFIGMVLLLLGNFVGIVAGCVVVGTTATSTSTPPGGDDGDGGLDKASQPLPMTTCDPAMSSNPTK